MHVIANNEANYWYLLEHKGRLIFQTCCTSSVAWFTVTTELREDELNEYRKRGDAYLDEFSTAINGTRPGRPDLASPYLARLIDPSEEPLVSSAITQWLDGKRAG